MARLARFGVVLHVCLLVWLALLPAPSAAQTGTGVISGVVVDESSNRPLPGAIVSIEGSTLTTASGRDGRFQLVGVSAGQRKLIAQYLGREVATSSVTVVAGQVLTVEVALPKELVVREEVTVSATPIQEGQARALNQQKTAPNIVNMISADQIGQFPDANAAEATQRVPGVTIERDQGEGRYVAVRGTEPRLNSMMINGERIPSPEGDIRAVALDVVPTDLLDAIEVSKALTPDMDADAIGGAVNLVTKAPSARARAFGTVAGGYNRLMTDWGQGTFTGTGGRRFAGGALGVILTGSANDVNRGSDNFESEYDDGYLGAFELRDYTINRERYGLNGALDYQASPSSALTVRGIFNSFADQEYRRRVGSAISDNELEWEMKDRLETQKIGSLSLGGRHLLKNGTLFDFAASFAYAEEDEPNAYYTVFKHGDVQFNPNVTPTSIDPDNIRVNPSPVDPGDALFDGQSIDDNLTTDRDIVGGVNMRMPFGGSTAFAGSVKIGAKYRNKAKKRDASTTVFETSEDIFMRGLLEPGFDPQNFYQGRYDFGPFFSADAVRALNGRPDFESESDVEADLADYDARERVGAAYAMADLAVGSKLTLLPGVRVERTSHDARGVELRFDDEGDFSGLAETSATGSYTHVLPGVHARYAITPDTNLRASVTRSLARPNYYDLVPYQLVLDEDLEIERGNAALKPSTSWNLDLMAERYFRSVGLVSAGFFHKSIANFIFPFRFEEERAGESYDVTQPQNGQTASVTGVELAVQNQLRFLPPPFDGIGLFANYTFTTSTAELPERTADSLHLPGQVRHSGNLSAWYEKGGFSARVALTFRDRFLSEVGGEAAEDLFVDRHHQLDLSVSHSVTRSIRIFADMLNLTNRPLRVYEAKVDRPIQEEYYRSWATFGVPIRILMPTSRKASWHPPVRALCSILVLLPLAAACGLAPTADRGPAPVALTIAPALETEAVAHDPDDPAIWVCVADPARSLILATDKVRETGGLYVFGLDGKVKQVVAPLDRPNNVDVEYGFTFGSERLDIAVLTERKQRRLRVFAIPPDGGELRDLAPAGLEVLNGQQGEAGEPMGIALYKRRRDSAIFAIVSPKTGEARGYLWQYLLEGDGTTMKATLVRRFGSFSGAGPLPGQPGEIEAVTVDDQLGYVYYSDERFGIRKWHADPDATGAETELAAFGTKGYEGDREGLSIFERANGTGFLVSSDQVEGGSRVQIYPREGAPGQPHLHDVLAVIATTADDTDGLDVTSHAMPGFPSGLVVMMNSARRNFQLYKWDDVAASLSSPH